METLENESNSGNGGVRPHRTWLKFIENPNFLEQVRNRLVQEVSPIDVYDEKKQ